MNAGNDTNLKKLIGFVQQKGVVTAPFLLRQGIGYQSMFEYRQSGWLTALGVGAFCGKGAKPSLDEALSALSDQLKLPLHLGGKTALARRGIQQ